MHCVPRKRNYFSGPVLVTKLDLIQQQATMNKRQSLEEFIVLKNRIKRLEDIALKQQNGPTEPAAETSSTTTPSQEPQRQQRFWLPPPRQDPNKIMVECNIPESIVNILMVRAKQQVSIMSCLRSICYPAKNPTLTDFETFKCFVNCVFAKATFSKTFPLN